MIEFNIAPNTQIGRIDIWNKWKVEYKGNILYVKDNGSTYEFPETEIDNQKVPKKIQLFLDEECTQPAYVNADGSPASIDYIPEEFKTIEYIKFYDNENIYHNPKYSRSGEFVENLVCDNIIEFCKRWFGLAGIKEILNDMKEYQTNFLRFFGSGEPYFGSYTIDQNTRKLIECPISDITQRKVEKVFISAEEDRQALFDFRNSKEYGVDTEYAKSRVNGIYFRNN